MPIYEYRCDCGHQFEKLTRLNDDSVHACPVCGGETRKVFSVFTKPRSSGTLSSADFSSSGCSGCSSSSCASCH
ncbi:MAG: zinc ribbon domain-containing protein [Firmicutes bacterium]|nr:zinc ribbon domain-containing protein [Bacillota bacterium]